MRRLGAVILANKYLIIIKGANNCSQHVLEKNIYPAFNLHIIKLHIIYIKPKQTLQISLVLTKAKAKAHLCIQKL